jgi:hypothetical protein
VLTPTWLKILGRAVLGLLACYVLFAALILIWFEWSWGPVRAQMDILRKSGSLTTGTVTSLEQHNGVCYRYVVNGTSYSACHNAYYPGEEASQLSVNQSIHVVYDVSDPGLSCSCQPQSEYASRTAGPFVAAILGAIGPALIAFLEARKRLRRRAAREADKQSHVVQS